MRRQLTDMLYSPLSSPFKAQVGFDAMHTIGEGTARILWQILDEKKKFSICHTVIKEMMRG